MLRRGLAQVDPPGPRVPFRFLRPLVAPLLLLAICGLAQAPALAVDFSALKNAVDNVTDGMVKVTPQAAPAREQIGQAVADNLATMVRQGDLKTVDHISGEWQERKERDDAMVDFLVCPE